MAIQYIQAVGSNQSKTSGTSISISSLSLSVAAGDDIIVGWAGDTGYGNINTPTHTGTATITWSSYDGSVNAGNVAAFLLRGRVTGAGTVTAITVSWTTAITAKAIVAGWYRQLDTTTGFGSDTVDAGSASFSAFIDCTSRDTAGLAIGVLGFEGPNGDTYTISQNPAGHGTPTTVGKNGTTGGGASANITCLLAHSFGSSGWGTFQWTNTTRSGDFASIGQVFSADAAAQPADITVNQLTSRVYPEPAGVRASRW